MARKRSRSKASKRQSKSKSKSRIRYTAKGLPYPSDLNRSDKGLVLEDDKGNLKQLNLSSRGKLSWLGADVKELSKKRSDYFYDMLDKNLDDEEKIRDILVKVLKEVKPKVSKKY